VSSPEVAFDNGKRDIPHMAILSIEPLARLLNSEATGRRAKDLKLAANA
jgi:hypothetical protein